MKKLFLLLFVGVTTLLQAQKQIVWFDAGLKVMAGGGSFLNQDVSDHKDVNFDIPFTNVLGFGGRVGANFGYHGISLEGMYTNGSITLESLGAEKVPTIDFTNIDIYALYRTGKNLGYFELGPKVSLLRKLDMGSDDRLSDFNSTNYSAVLGFGAYLIGGEGAFSGILGLRLEYGVNDWVSASGKTANAPVGRYVSDFTNKSSTNPVFAGLVFELNWGIGYYGVAQCGKRAKFIMF